MRISDWSSDVCSSDLFSKPWPQAPLKIIAGGGLTCCAPASAGESDMSPLKNFLAIALYALPSIGIAYGLSASGILDPKLSMLAGLIACLLGAEAHAALARGIERREVRRSEEHTSTLKSLMRISFAVFRLKKI